MIEWKSDAEQGQDDGAEAAKAGRPPLIGNPQRVTEEYADGWRKGYAGELARMAAAPAPRTFGGKA